jgi:hypothetical protein
VQHQKHRGSGFARPLVLPLFRGVTPQAARGVFSSA